MQRRKFLKLAALSGLAVGSTVGMPVHARGPGHQGPLLVVVHATGGWDPRLVCDPVLDPAQNRVYTEIATAGEIAYAPLAMTRRTTGLGGASAKTLMGSTEFFDKYANRLHCINGIDIGTVRHDEATSSLLTGQPTEGALSIAELLALDSGLPHLASHRGDTSGVAPSARLPSVDPDQPFERSCDPDACLGGRAHDALAVPSSAAPPIELGGELQDLQRFMRQAEVALAAFESNLAVAVHLELGGFDTHGSHDRAQVTQLGKLFRGVDFLMTEAERRGLTQRLTVMIGSEFGRGPDYDSPQPFAGKDHWPVGSAMLMGRGVVGNRVSGATDAQQRPYPLSGRTWTPADVHRELGVACGVESPAQSDAGEGPSPIR